MIQNFCKNDKRIITIHTKNTTYQMMVEEHGFLLHLYYGPRLSENMAYRIVCEDRGFSGNPYDLGDDRTFSMDVMPQEYPCYGNGDYRITGFQMKTEDGVYGCDLRYVEHRIVEGKYQIEGMPAVYANPEQAQTLEIDLEDRLTGVKVTLRFGILPELDMITRSVRIINCGAAPVYIEKAVSASLDLLEGDYEILSFHGCHGMERQLQRRTVEHGTFSVGSIRGASSHHANPFVILAKNDTTEDFGECFGIHFLYSGNFLCETEKDAFSLTRVNMGIHPQRFSYELKNGECFDTPEAVLSYGNCGLTELSQRFHKLIRNHVCRGKYKLTRRPILINNWEATYFDFTGEKILDIAKQAADLGVEMFVLDDGWFGKRDDDFSGLGDWYVNEKKLGAPLKTIVEQINQMGLKFGLWIEPEMINEDSDLYREHPDWAFTIPGRKPVRARSQLVLDFSRKEVVDHVLEQIFKVCDDAHVEYIKMDMNRNICDVYSAVEGVQNSGTILHKYILGVYDFMERLLTRYPELLLEGCAGGGGRFDAGMLYYAPQIWCSDNTDAIERTWIQYGTSFGYPISAVGSHVSAVPNHQTGRVTPIQTRAVVAMAGSFGYELDLTLISEEEKLLVKEQIKDYKKYWNLIHNGKYYRLSNPEKEKEYTAWEFVSEDKDEFLVCVVVRDAHFNNPVKYVKAKGLERDARYKIEESAMELEGGALMYGGVPIPSRIGEYQSFCIHGIRTEKGDC